MDPSDPPPSSTPPGPLDGLTNARGLALERVAIRTRENGATLSAWRLAAAAEEGEGGIVLVEGAGGATHWRGEGVFLGWDAGRLAAAYAALLPRSDTEPFELHQLG
jgi:hypothetical protein